MSIPLNQGLQCKPEEEVLALLENYSAALIVIDEVIKYMLFSRIQKGKKKLLNMTVHRTWETTWVLSHSLDLQVTFPWSIQMSCGMDQKRENKPRKEAQ